MEPLFACVILFLSFAADPAESIQCYNCAATQMNFVGAPTLSPAEMKCLDPFNMEGIEKVECNGKCYGQVSSVTGQYPVNDVKRGCAAGSEPLPFLAGCLDPNAIPGAPQGMTPPPGEGPPPGTSGEMCTYYCDGDLCNSAVIQDTAREQTPPAVEGTRKCYQCEEVKADATEGSCASDDFNGEGVTQVDCDGKCVLMMGQNEGVDSVYRGCDVSMGQMCQMPGATCCTEELCNGKVESGDGSGEDDDGVGIINCWNCMAPHSEKEKTFCSEGKFDDDMENINNVTKVECPTGKCVSLIMMVPGGNKNESMFVRDCLNPAIGEGICEKGATEMEKYKMYSKVDCCDDNLCNGAPVVTSCMTAIFLSTFYVLVSHVLM